MKTPLMELYEQRKDEIENCLKKLRESDKCMDWGNFASVRRRPMIATVIYYLQQYAGYADGVSIKELRAFLYCIYLVEKDKYEKMVSSMVWCPLEQTLEEITGRLVKINSDGKYEVNLEEFKQKEKNRKLTYWKVLRPICEKAERICNYMLNPLNVRPEGITVEEFFEKGFSEKDLDKLIDAYESAWEKEKTLYADGYAKLLISVAEYYEKKPNKYEDEEILEKYGKLCEKLCKVINERKHEMPILNRMIIDTFEVESYIKANYGNELNYKLVNTLERIASELGIYHEVYGALYYGMEFKFKKDRNKKNEKKERKKERKKIDLKQLVKPEGITVEEFFEKGFSEEDLDELINAYESAWEKEKTIYADGYLKLLISIAEYYEKEHEKFSSDEFLRKIYEIFENAKLPVYKKLAAKYYIRASDIATSVSLIYSPQQNYPEEAEKYLKMAVEFNEKAIKLGIVPKFHSITLNNLGTHYYEMNRSEEALPILKKALEYAKTPKEKGLIMHNLALTYADLGKKRDAVRCMIKSICIHYKTQHEFGHVTLYNEDIDRIIKMTGDVNTDIYALKVALDLVGGNLTVEEAKKFLDLIDRSEWPLTDALLSILSGEEYKVPEGLEECSTLLEDVVKVVEYVRRRNDRK
ncbi:tetratricopeptide repeat protein [Methanotorris igneus]|uniref:Uncharacterized protein n=1 Tax=Methanotorris igneus (strain DSM 5666 / JCM 11834 / Kol 5) TaxID=880724 RepID=F6BF64_METIK|nr:tetratricopeptide repeat protein [Methanotorris igneus]AEF96934.1 hypothetical protein Metig_1399 [Methanotorris igneus Kol 5]